MNPLKILPPRNFYSLMTDICLSNIRNEIIIAKDTYRALSVIELNPAYLAFLITLL